MFLHFSPDRMHYGCPKDYRGTVYDQKHLNTMFANLVKYLGRNVNEAFSSQSHFATVPQGSRYFLTMFVNTECSQRFTILPDCVLEVHVSK